MITMRRTLTVHFKLYRSNYFLIISNQFGKVLLTKSSGNLGFQHIQKRSVEALDALIVLAIKFVLTVDNHSIFLKLEGFNKKNLEEIYLQFLQIIKKYKIITNGFSIINKIPHNGCRKKFR